MDLSVAVVIATYNRVTVLPRAILSVLMQDYPDWVCYVVGDHCTDGTNKLMGELCKRYPERLRYRNLPEHTGRRFNKTGAAVKDFGIRISKEPLIAFLDDDNEWLNNHLEVLVGAYLKGERRAKNRVGLVWSDMNYLTADSGRFFRRHLSSGPPKEGSIDSSEMMITREAVKVAGGWTCRFPPEGSDWRVRYDDFLLADRIVRAGFSWIHVPRVTVNYWDRRPVRPQPRHCAQPKRGTVPGPERFPENVPPAQTPSQRYLEGLQGRV